MLHFIGALLGGAMLPLELFPAPLAKLLAYTPFIYLYYFPVKVLVGQVAGPALLKGVLVMIFWLLVTATVARLVWLKGQKRYSGVGI